MTTETGTKKSRANQKERTAVAREKIIDAALHCYATKGYGDTSMADIAREAGCSRELPRYHFGSKEKLADSVLEYGKSFWRAQWELASDEVDGAKAFERIVDNIYQQIVDNPQKLRGQISLIFSASDPANTTLRREVALIKSTMVENFIRIIERGLERQGCTTRASTIKRLGVPVETLAELLYASIRGVLFMWIVDPDNTNLRHLFSGFEAFVSKTLNSELNS